MCSNTQYSFICHSLFGIDEGMELASPLQPRIRRITASRLQPCHDHDLAMTWPYLAAWPCLACISNCSCKPLMLAPSSARRHSVRGLKPHCQNPSMVELMPRCDVTICRHAVQDYIHFTPLRGPGDLHQGQHANSNPFHHQLVPSRCFDITCATFPSSHK